MSGLPPGLPEDHGYKTLGWDLLDWGSTYLAQPDGINKGTTWQYTNDQARFILWFYALHPDTVFDYKAGKFAQGGWLFRRAYRERAKGVGKTPMVAAIASTELLGPVQFDGWDANGNPVGRPHPNPLVQLAAVSESQADQTMVLINSMLANGTAESEYGLDIALSRIYVPNGGKLEKVTASPRSREGARPTFVVLEETHNWVPAERGPEFAEVLRRNLGKLDGRSVEVTNAPLPGENSVAEASHREFSRLAQDGHLGGVLFDSESIHVEDVKDPEQAIPALKWIYRNSPWVNVNRIFEEICDSNTRESSARKFYFNEIVIGESGWLKKKEIEACRKDKLKKLKKSDRIALGFKGATRNGAACVVACRLKDQALFVLKMWEKPEDAPRDWEVDYYEVDQFMRKQFETRDVFFAYGDPHQYQDIMGRWAADYEDVIEEFWLSSKAKYAKAIEGFESAVRNQRVVWNDQADLERHILNCHILETPQGDLIRKETQDSKRYIAAAQAAVLALEACKEAIERGGLAPEVESHPETVGFSLRQLCDEVLTLLEPRALANDSLVLCRIDPRLATHQRGAEQYLRQVLSNLLANAIKFTEGGEILVEVEVLREQAGRQHLRLSVSDDGIGICEAMQPKIFDRFVQASEAVARRYGGTGLGLAISKHLVEQMGGQIGVRSREGEGSCFWFELDLEAVQQADALPAGVASTAPLDILVVEDVALNREVVRGLLERDGHRVWLAEDAEQGLELCAQRRFDLLLLDVHLPGISGVALCRQVRAGDTANRDTRILALTASVQPGLVRAYLDAGMQGVLGKPLKLANLRQALAGQDQQQQPAPATWLDHDLLDTHRTLLGAQKLQGLLAGLRDALHQQRQALLEAVAAGDCTEVTHLAHRLAGSSDSLGFCGLAATLRSLETHALARDKTAVQAMAASLSEQLLRAEHSLAELLAA